VALAMLPLPAMLGAASGPPLGVLMCFAEYDFLVQKSRREDSRYGLDPGDFDVLAVALPGTFVISRSLASSKVRTRTTNAKHPRGVRAPVAQASATGRNVARRTVAAGWHKGMA
jgi:hypothetical protein